jgi:hypothetical protein
MEFAGVFIKFGNEPHLLKLQKEGLLHCNTIEYFSNLEDGNLRGDDLENIVELDYLAEEFLELAPISAPNFKKTTLKVKNVRRCWSSSLTSSPPSGFQPTAISNTNHKA